MPGTVHARVLENRFARLLLHFLVAMPILLLPFFLGGARPWFWAPIAGLFMIGISIYLWIEGEGPALTAGVPKKTLIVGAVFIGYPLLQVVPLPLPLLSILDADRALWLQRASDVTGLRAGLTSVSYMPLTTLFAVFWCIFLFIFALVFIKTCKEKNFIDWFLRLLFLLASAEAVYGLLQVLIPSMGVLWESAGSGDARGTFVNRNHYAAFLGMIWPVLLAYLLSRSKTLSQGEARSYYEQEEASQIRQKQAFMAFLIGIVLLALVFSESRGGILGALISLTVFTVFGRINTKGMIGFVIAGWVVMIFYGSIIGFQGILERFDVLEEGASGRFRIWEDSWRLIRDHFMTGTGLDTFPMAIRLYQSHLTDQNQIVHAHNDYLELMAEFGLPFASVVILTVWGYVIWAAGRIWKLKPAAAGSLPKISAETRQALQRRLIRAGALAGGTAFLVHSLAEFNWQIPANQLYFIILLVLMNL